MRQDPRQMPASDMYPDPPVAAGPSTPMTLNTRHLFARLLRVMRINAVCDVGSMDGADALLFRNVLKRAIIYAFEPNPENFRLMQLDPVFRARDIRLVPFAATNYDGQAKFFVVDADYSTSNPRRGMSSLYLRSGAGKARVSADVTTVRLDTFLAGRSPSDARWALWIDTEGKAYEVIEGIAGVIEHIHLLHVEVETVACIGAHQKLYPEVRMLLNTLGFVELATDQPSTRAQFNALFVRRELPADMRLRLRRAAALARLRHHVALAVREICPPGTRHRIASTRAWSLVRDTRIGHTLRGLGSWLR